MTYRYALFDFDGTLADTKEGILSAAAYSLRFFGIDADRDTLMKFVGPTLWHSYETLFGFDRVKADEAVRYYREYYSEKGIYEACLYPGISEMLSQLTSAGVRLAVGSSKNEVFVTRALDHFGIREYFDIVIGSTPEGGHSSKDELIGMLMEGFGDADSSSYVYAGDSRSDMIGASKKNVDFIAALYDRDDSEFEGLVTRYEARSVEDMTRAVLGKYDDKLQ